MQHTQTPAVLLILDGFGDRPEKKDNAIANAQTPHLDRLKKEYAYNTIDASERMVGLPKGQFGNSEVGHLNIGAGRVVGQDIVRIDMAIESEEYSKNAVLQDAFQKVGEHSLHLLGLFSDGGVHSHINHFFATLDAALAFGIKSIVVHPFLDGRDTPPRSAEPYLKKLALYQEKHPSVVVGTVIGRFFSMDRDNRWDRVEAAYNALVVNDAPFNSDTVLDALELAYEREENDEFVQPTLINGGAPIKDNDVVIFLNFRADRCRELASALTNPSFNGFNRKKCIKPMCFVTMTSYSKEFDFPVLFPPREIRNGFGEYISNKGLSQLRIAETEKYPHVTYFFSGGREEPFSLEERVLIPSPKVKTYDTQPEMSAREITARLVSAINGHEFDAIICNFANGDMVGHTGVMDAAVKAVEVLDECVGAVVEAAKNNGAEVLITADHGNCERMYDPIHQQIHTQHTLDPVPFLYIGRKAKIKSGGALKDIAPTLLTILNLPKPSEMSGESLIEFL